MNHHKIISCTLNPTLQEEESCTLNPTLQEEEINRLTHYSQNIFNYLSGSGSLKGRIENFLIYLRLKNGAEVFNVRLNKVKNFKKILEESWDGNAPLKLLQIEREGLQGKQTFAHYLVTIKLAKEQGHHLIWEYVKERKIKDLPRDIMLLAMYAKLNIEGKLSGEDYEELNHIVEEPKPDYIKSMFPNNKEPLKIGENYTVPINTYDQFKEIAEKLSTALSKRLSDDDLASLKKLETFGKRNNRRYHEFHFTRENGYPKPLFFPEIPKVETEDLELFKTCRKIILKALTEELEKVGLNLVQSHGLLTEKEATKMLEKGNLFIEPPGMVGFPLHGNIHPIQVLMILIASGAQECDDGPKLIETLLEYPVKSDTHHWDINLDRSLNSSGLFNKPHTWQAVFLHECISGNNQALRVLTQGILALYLSDLSVGLPLQDPTKLAAIMNRRILLEACTRHIVRPDLTPESVMLDIANTLT